ncbi:cardiolipin synthase [Crassaminicella profunda]|uniref:cardiolipin synthase n=1 Tax=Crassaminicella profunda TaxID=1286698 RepID=UPI001CA71A1D|nr:cardiolipin synthase [Crassaminicella profunda]QZY54904.1 cardiolipin synthase [Crassaminicella profunda]
MQSFISTLSLLFILNILLAIVIIFLERKNPTSTLAWLMVLVLLPNIGFILYLIFGQNLSKQKIFKLKTEEDQILRKMVLQQISYLQNNKINFNDPSIKQYQDMMHMHLVSSDSIFCQDNEVEIFIDGTEKFNALIQSIEKAQDHIHMLYYIIQNDSLGKRIVNALTKKASTGVQVRLLYDAVGSHRLPRNFFNELTAAGGQVSSFFPFKIPFINFRINFRNHRKLAIIDGKYGFIGGFNIGNEYLGLDKKLGYWRDTHLKLKGSAVQMIQLRFILDWQYASKETIDYDSKYFPPINTNGKTGIQIVSSGPDSEQEQIKNGYLKMIHSARKSIYIQTPYFIPDESILAALRIAALSGADVRLMIPSKPDHMFVYWATYSYIGELLQSGVRTFLYDKGFIHAKTIIVDGKLASVGTANIDVRSFKLNFEVNAFIYDTTTSSALKSIFEKDMTDCTEITSEIYKKRSKIIKFKESIFRLLSPIL